LRCRKTAVKYTGIFFISYGLLSYFIDSQLDVEPGETAEDGPPTVDGVNAGAVDDEPEETDVEEEGFFLPYSRYREAPLDFYKATDPEYQEFIKFNRSHKRQAYVISKFSCTRSLRSSPLTLDRLAGSMHTQIFGTQL
jgi:hypothetical protein